jgi:hypothetical protein
LLNDPKGAFFINERGEKIYYDDLVALKIPWRGRKKKIKRKSRLTERKYL